MAVPKRKKSKSKRDKRRTHQKIAAPSVVTCPQCEHSFKVEQPALGGS